jgi:trimethylamine--corrinoid protein Co-methyltransferase
MAGVTTPITAAGTLALLNAELLAGLVLLQLMSPGAPVVLGSLPASTDMRAMMSYYGPQTMLLNIACAEMMAHYGLPHSGTSGSGSGWGPDLAAAGLLWMNHLTACMGSAGLAPFVGGNFDSLVFSPVTAVYGAEVIRQARALAGGFAMDEESLGFDQIAEATPGGSFLMADLTLRRHRQADTPNAVAPRMTLEAWQAEGCPRAIDVLRQRTADLLRSLPAPDDHDEILECGEALIRRGVDNAGTRG